MFQKISTTLKNYFIITLILIFFICIFFIPFLSNIPPNITQNNTIQTILISNNNFYWPLPGYTRISSYFGYRNIPTQGATSFHGGIDIPAPSGTNIVSSISGTVTYIGFMGSGGCTIIITNNAYSTIYHHISPNYIVKKGDHVYQGQIIAHVGPKNIYGISNNPYKDSSR